MTRRSEWLGLAAIVTLAAALRYAYFGLLEFQGDEAYAAQLALQFVKTGKLPLAGLLAAGNVVFMLDYYRFVEGNGGAQGSAGTALGSKLVAARYLAEQGGARLQTECESQLAQMPARQPLLVEFNHDGKPELPQLEWPLLITQQPTGTGPWPTNLTVLMVDGNREAFPPQLWQQLGQLPGTNFGPIKLYFVKR